MLSEVHTMSHITYWFNEFVRLFKDIPNVFVSDMSSVLLNAAAKSFGGCADLTDYIDWLFNTLRKTDNNARNVNCFIRIDVAHLVKNVTTCDALKLKSSLQREFFIRATCLIVKCTGLTQAERVLRSILIVAKSDTKGESFSVHKTYLDDLIANDEPITGANVVSNELQKEAGGVIDDEDFQPSSSVKDWLIEIGRSTTGEATENDENAENNDFENKAFAKFLLQLCQTLVLWSGVAASHFDAPARASSAYVEGYFKHLKSDLESVFPARADESVIAHIDLLDRMIIEASQEYIEFIDAEGGVKKLLGNHTELINEIEEVEDEIEYYANQLEDETESTENIGNAQNTKENDTVVDASSNDGIQSNQNSIKKTVKNCAACKDGQKPSGTYLCFLCNKAVHALRGCSVSLDGDDVDDGYGELRVCISCENASKARADKENTQSKKKSNADEIAKGLNQTEKWDRKAKSNSRYSYLSSVPAWKIDKKVQSKPKTQPALLINGSLSTTCHTVEKQRVAIRNTCSPDAICQVGSQYNMLDFDLCSEEIMWCSYCVTCF